MEIKAWLFPAASVQQCKGGLVSDQAERSSSPHARSQRTSGLKITHLAAFCRECDANGVPGLRDVGHKAWKVTASMVGRFLEFRTRKMAAHPWMTRAWESSKATALAHNHCQAERDFEIVVILY